MARERVLGGPPFAAELLELESGPALVLRGELDLLTGSLVELAFADAEALGATVRVVDLRGLDFMDLSGLDGLLGAARRRRRGDQRLVVVIGAGRGRRLLEILDVSAQLEVVDFGPEARARG
jgi:anti-anti-sigma factor